MTKATASPTPLVEAIKDYDQQKTISGVYEYQLLTDVNAISDALDIGPLSFLNTLAHAGRQSNFGMKAAVVVRVTENLRSHPKFRYDDNYKHYHGGDIIDEIAAIVSLILGVRMYGGSLRREFNLHTGALGRPIEYDSKAKPLIDIDYARLRVPRAVSGIDLRHLSIIGRLASLEIEESTALVKAARLYQQGLLMCESAPELSWLLFVSAIETLSGRFGLSTLTSVEIFRQAHAVIAEIMRHYPLFEARLASHFAPILKSGAKFKAFLSRFCPTPPSNRPPQYVRCDFADEMFVKDITTIYGYRSKHLHDGIAFPAPMCDAPRYWDQPDIEEKAFSEKPMDGGANYAGASWGPGACPMLLCHFEYLTRGAILNWWKSRDQEIDFNIDGRDPVRSSRS